MTAETDFFTHDLITRVLNTIRKHSTCRHPGTRRVSLYLISEVRNSVASRMQRVNTAFQFYVFLKLDNMK